MLIIDDRIRELVGRIDAATSITPALGADIRELVGRLRWSCARPAVVADYAAYHDANGGIAPYPVDAGGYAMAFDPLRQEAAFRSAWHRYGIVVSKNAASPELCGQAIRRVGDLTRSASGGRCDLSRAETWGQMPLDAAGAPLLSRGFFEVYHDAVLAALRQSVRVYLHYVLVWGHADLWTSFDRLGVKLPGHVESQALPLHVDQNPNVHPSFRTVQGVLALSDCPAERGTFVGVPGSKLHFHDYRSMARNSGEYVELDTAAPIAATFAANMQPFPLRPGSLVSWDSRTTHANSENVSPDTRFVAYVACGPAREREEPFRNARNEAFRSGVGSNNRDALMHASKPPRYANHALLAGLRETESLTLLGRLLYGQETYAQIPAIESAS